MSRNTAAPIGRISSRPSRTAHRSRRNGLRGRTRISVSSSTAAASSCSTAIRSSIRATPCSSPARPGREARRKPTSTRRTFTMAYVGVSTNSLANAGCYTLADGRQFFDFVAVFAANLDGPPNVPVLSFTLPVNATLYDTDDVKKLQNLGITVLLTVVNNWSKAGWSEFTDQTAAQWFVDQLVAAVDRFGLDGIDIDDEYSIGTPTDTNLAMVTTLLRQALPGKIVSKALFDDSQ